MEYLIGFVAGVVISMLVHIIMNKCSHRWEHIGETNVYAHGTNKENSYPVKTYKTYQCPKCLNTKKVNT